jgi:hypothetical protein
MTTLSMRHVGPLDARRQPRSATWGSCVGLVCGLMWAGLVAWSADVPLREAVTRRARPAVSRLLTELEGQAGLTVIFGALPTDSAVAACCSYDPFRNEPRIQLRRDWQDVDVAHELMHLRLDLLEGFSVLAWRRDVPHTEAVEAAFGRVQTYVKDEVVHARLIRAGLQLEGEVLRPPLFDDLYINAARDLEEGRSRAADGMAHLDKLGYGRLCRAAFLVQAELILQNYRGRLSARRVQQAERFIRAFRNQRAPEAVQADAVLVLFREHDVQAPSGQREILRRWAAMESLDKFVGVSAYRKTPRGNYVLPFPPN